MDNTDKEYLIFRILGISRWNEQALRDMSDERLRELYDDLLQKESSRK